MDEETSLCYCLTSCDVGAFVIASQQKEVLGVLDFVAKKKENGFETLFATVDIIAQEKVIGRGRETAHFEQANEVRVLAMDVTDNLYRRGEFNKSRLAEEDFAGG